MRLTRARVRSLISAVAVAGLLIWGTGEASRLVRLSREYRGLASTNAGLQRYCTKVSETLKTRAESYQRVARELRAGRTPADLAEHDLHPAANDAKERMAMAGIAERTAITLAQMFEQNRPVVDHYKRLRLKYERAARYPWLTVAPDPPRPKMAP